MKSDLQEVRIALICFALGCPPAGFAWGVAEAGGGAATAAGGVGAATVGAAGDGGAATVGAATGVGVAVVVVAPTAVWQPGESCAALARRQSRSSGLVG
jgi:hypothetical protein